MSFLRQLDFAHHDEPESAAGPIPPSSALTGNTAAPARYEAVPNANCIEPALEEIRKEMNV